MVDLLVEFAPWRVHIYILPCCSTAAATVLNSAGDGAQFARSRCSISGGILNIYTGKITNWSEVGCDDAEIVVIGREAGSGTRSGFEEIVEVKDLCKYRQELSSTGDVITTVAQNPGAIGYASLASVKDTVKAVNVEGVTPSEQSVKDGTYAIQRPFVLATKTDAKLNDVAQAFFDYVTSPDANDVITAAGVVPNN